MELVEEDLLEEEDILQDEVIHQEDLAAPEGGLEAEVDLETVVQDPALHLQGDQGLVRLLAQHPQEDLLRDL